MKFGPTAQACFREGPVGNSESRTGLTRNPINRVPSARFARLRRELQISYPQIYCLNWVHYLNPMNELEIISI